MFVRYDYSKKNNLFIKFIPNSLIKDTLVRITKSQKCTVKRIICIFHIFFINILIFHFFLLRLSNRNEQKINSVG